MTERKGALPLTPEELARTAIEDAPVVRGQLHVSREFPATVQSNENELAEVTTLIRGRVVKVHVDVGQDVEKDTLLAMLHSTELGVAERAYLKAKARVHEAALAYERAKDLHEHKNDNLQLMDLVLHVCFALVNFARHFLKEPPELSQFVASLS